MTRTGIKIAVCTGIAALVLTACDADEALQEAEEQSADGHETITVYTSEPQEKIDELIADFAEVEPDVEVEVFRAGTGDLTARLDTELATGEPEADVFLAADAPTFEELTADDLLMPIESEHAEQVSQGFQDEDGYYIGTRLIPTVLAYNTNELSSAPGSWQDLTNPEFDSAVTLPNPSVSGAAAFNTAMWSLDENLGEEWFNDLGANSPVVQDSNGPVSQAVADGSQPVGVVVDFMMRDLRDEGSPVEVVYPEEGAPYIYQPIGIFESTSEPEAAQAFVDYVLSERGQEFAVEQNYLPVREDVGSPQGAPAVDDVSLMDADLEEVTAIQDEALELFSETIGGS